MMEIRSITFSDFLVSTGLMSSMWWPSPYSASRKCVSLDTEKAIDESNLRIATQMVNAMEKVWKDISDYSNTNRPFV